MILRRQVLLAAYVVVILGPLAFMLAGRNPAGSGALVLSAVGLGGVAFAGMALQFVLVSRWRTIARPFGADLLIRFHRAMGIGIVALVIGHVVLIAAHRRDRIESLLDEAGNLFGIVALTSLLLLTVASWPRTRPRGSYEAWRLMHGALGVTALAAAFVHVIKVGHFATNDVIAWFVAAVSALGISMLFALRVLRPFRLGGQAFQLVHIEPERGDAVTITLKPEGTSAEDWYPGQFGWLKLANRPYGLAEHPFSMSSSAVDRTTISFTCKAVGEFTRQIRELPIGERILIDGPHGSHRPSTRGVSRFMVVAGSGIAPAMSLLRTMADTGDVGSVHLVYGVRSLESATFAEAISALQSSLSLRVDYVASQAGPGWSGRRGRVDDAVLREVAPPDVAQRAVFVCGPAEFVDTVLRSFAGLGVPRDHIHAERF